MSRRHHRVAQKEVESAELDGVYMHKDCIAKIIYAVIGFAVLLFVKGLIIGYLSCKKCENDTIL